MARPDFYVGIHQPHWIYRPEMAGMKFFISANRLRDRKRWKHAPGIRWALDSGGFTEIAKYGRWTATPERYVGDVYRWSWEIGQPDFCAPQDWMCESPMLKRTAYVDGLIRPRGRTAGLSLGQIVDLCPDLTAEQEADRIRVHQARTVANFLRLRELAPDLPFIPVLQGYQTADYVRHVADYKAAGVDLEAETRVGVGSVCRRQGTHEIAELFRALSGMGLKLHGFGVKAGGLKLSADYLASSDSMAWSFTARRSDPLPGCAHKNCANCPIYARRYYFNILETIAAA